MIEAQSRRWSSEYLDGRTLLIVDERSAFSTRLAGAMGVNGATRWRVGGERHRRPRAVDGAPPAFAVIDMRLNDGNGLEVINPPQRRRAPDARRCRPQPATATSPTPP